MTILKHEFASEIQRRLSQANVYWDNEPSPRFFDEPCKPTAASLSDPAKRFTMNFPKGLGDEPLDDVVEVFVESFLDEIKN